MLELHINCLDHRKENSWKEEEKISAEIEILEHLNYKL